MTVAPHVSARDRRVRETLERYFGIPIGADHPLLEQIGMLHLNGGDWLMHQGDEGDALYFLVRGRLQAWAAGADGRNRGTFLNEIVAGDSVGELSLLTGAPRTVGVQAIRDSLLVSIDRQTFETLVMQFPSLGLKLAGNVANLLQNRHSRAAATTRNLQAITILNLDDGARTFGLCRRLAETMSEPGQTLLLSPERLAELGAPVTDVTGKEEIPDTLADWFHEKEDEHRFVLFQCHADHPAWTRFALRQSDMVLLVADGSGNPQVRRWEAEVLSDAGAAIARRLLVLLHPGEGPYDTTPQWLEDRELDFHVHVRRDHPEDTDRVTRIVTGNALGLVLAGGAARGFAHLGVYRAMEELALPVDWIGGTSIGGIMGAALAAHWSTDEAIERARECFVAGKPFSDFTLPLISLIRGRRMARLIHEHFDFPIEGLQTPFFCLSCHLDTGEVKVHERGHLGDAVRAGASIPGILPPAVVDRRLAVDGAVSNNLPVDIMQRKPVGNIVAVDLSSHRRVEVDYPETPSPWAVLRGRYLPFSPKYRVPGFSTVMLKATELGTLSHVRDLGRQADLLLQPQVRHFGMTEVKSFDAIVEAGYEHAMSELPAWMESRDVDR
ncbi:MAG: cyclic nucleotide-binding domain-containing protein [Gammaproteobacteria bacterium]|nr:cyclic nucleotide-binding domain-containing protein [Gammaproteobacteria bacterium]